MGKRMDIRIVDEDRGILYLYDHETKCIDETFYLTNIRKDEYPHIYLDHTITDEEFDDAINIIITAFMQKDINTIEVNLERKNGALSPAREMTIKDIEKELGHKIKIIDDKEG